MSAAPNDCRGAGHERSIAVVRACSPQEASVWLDLIPRLSRNVYTGRRTKTGNSLMTTQTRGQILTVCVGAVKLRHEISRISTLTGVNMARSGGFRPRVPLVQERAHASRLTPSPAPSRARRRVADL